MVRMVVKGSEVPGFRSSEVRFPCRQLSIEPGTYMLAANWQRTVGTRGNERRHPASFDRTEPVSRVLRFVYFFIFLRSAQRFFIISEIFLRAAADIRRRFRRGRTDSMAEST